MKSRCVLPALAFLRDIHDYDNMLYFYFASIYHFCI